MSDLAKVIVMVLVFGAALYLGYERYNECRRIHPIWYCLPSGK